MAERRKPPSKKKPSSLRKQGSKDAPSSLRKQGSKAKAIPASAGMTTTSAGMTTTSEGTTAKSAVPTDEAPLDLVAVRAQIDGIDREIQSLIADRALWARQVGKAKGKLAAAVDYYRPEREAQVLRRVVDRNEGPLADDVLVRLFREIMSACLAQQEPLKVGYLGPEGTF